MNTGKLKDPPLHGGGRGFESPRLHFKTLSAGTFLRRLAQDPLTPRTSSWFTVRLVYLISRQSAEGGPAKCNSWWCWRQWAFCPVDRWLARDGLRRIVGDLTLGRGG